VVTHMGWDNQVFDVRAFVIRDHICASDEQKNDNAANKSHIMSALNLKKKKGKKKREKREKRPTHKKFLRSSGKFNNTTADISNLQLSQARSM
jgi:hypothetical protein